MEDYQIAPEEKRKGQSISPFKYIFPKVIIFRLSLLCLSSQLPPDNDRSNLQGFNDYAIVVTIVYKVENSLIATNLFSLCAFL